MKYDKIINAFEEAKKEGISETAAYIAYSALAYHSVKPENLERFTSFVHEAWLKDETEIPIDTLISVAVSLARKTGLDSLLNMSRRDFLSHCCHEK